jgi:hypothetical protein
MNKRENTPKSIIRYQPAVSHWDELEQKLYQTSALLLPDIAFLLVESSFYKVYIKDGEKESIGRTRQVE